MGRRYRAATQAFLTLMFTATPVLAVDEVEITAIWMDSKYLDDYRVDSYGQTAPSAINDVGQTVGTLLINNYSHAARKRGFDVEDLGVLPGGYESVAYGINNSGAVVGYSVVATGGSSDFEHHAFVYTDTGKMQDLGNFGGIASYARDINDAGDIVGEYKTSDGVSHAFVLKKTGAKDFIPQLNGAPSGARAVNNQGAVVGYVDRPERRGFLYKNGALKILAPLSGDVSSEVYDINDSDQIVGKSVDANGVSRAVLYDGTLFSNSITPVDLTNHHAESIPNWALSTASGINNRAEIVGSGVYTVVYDNNRKKTSGYRLSRPRVSFQEQSFSTPPTYDSYYGYGIPVKVVGDAMVVGAKFYRFEQGTWALKQTLSPKFVQNGDLFGASVAFDGETIVIGAPSRHDGQYTSGAAFVFKLDASIWTQAAVLSPKIKEDVVNFGAAVAVDGDRIVVGSRLRSGGYDAYVFHRNEENWLEQQRLNATGSSSAFFDSIQISGNTIVSPGFTPTGYGNGIKEVNIFEWQDSQWVEMPRLDADYKFTYGSAKLSVAIHGDRLAVGLPRWNAFSTVDIYERVVGSSGTEWKKADSVGISYQFPIGGYQEYYYEYAGFGWSVDLSSDRLIVGALDGVQTLKGYEYGGVYLFERVGPRWQQVGHVVPDSSIAGQLSNITVALSGDKAIVGGNNQLRAYTLCDDTCRDPANFNIKSPTTSSKVERFENDPVWIAFEPSSVLLGVGGNHIALTVDGTALSERIYSYTPYELRELATGQHIVTASLRDANGVAINGVPERTVTFEVKVKQRLQVTYPAQDQVVLCGDEDYQVLEYIVNEGQADAWSIGDVLSISIDGNEVIRQTTPAASTATPKNLCDYLGSERPSHTLQLKLALASSNATIEHGPIQFTVQRVEPTWTVSAPVGGFTYKKGFLMVIDVQHRARGMQLLWVLNDVVQPPIVVTKNGETSIPIPAELLRVGENVLRMSMIESGSQDPVEIRFLVAAENPDSGSETKGGGAIDALSMLGLILVVTWSQRRAIARGLATAVEVSR